MLTTQQGCKVCQKVEMTATTALSKKFDQKTGSGVIVNTSFNVRGEPIVNTPQDAYRCFMARIWIFWCWRTMFSSKVNNPQRTKYPKTTHRPV